jgi:hypothetical protein
MMGMRRAAQARMQRVIERAKVKHAISAPAPAPAPLSLYDRARISKWIRDRLAVDWRGSCWQCRKPFAFGQKFIDVGGAEVTVRFHQQCESEWRVQQESAARRALGLERATRESDHG